MGDDLDEKFITDGMKPLCDTFKVEITNGGLNKDYAFNRKDFDEVYMYKEYPKLSFFDRMNKKKEKLSLFRVFVSIFPIFEWLPKYKWHTDLIHDIISGLTVAIMHIPQGLAYSILAGVPPVVGIYMAFFPVIIYSIMGTSRHISMGTFSIICLMAGKSYAEFGNENHQVPNLPVYSAIEVTTALSVVVGAWQILFGLLRMGSLCVLLSEHLVSGLVTGTAILVIASQLKYVFGINLRKRSGSLQLIYILSDLFENISATKYAALFTTLFVMILLLSYQQYLKDRVAKKVPFPIPTELIVIVSAALLSLQFDLPKRYDLTVVGNIPAGFPSPSIPPIELLPKLIVNGFVVAVISFSIDISMAFIFAEKHNYRVNANQELLASGTANIFGSFFSCPPFCASLSRSVIQDTAGGRTQLASLVSCGFLSLVILFIGPFFEPLPHCVLTGIVFAAMKGMLVNVKDFFAAWKQCRMDGCIWMITFLSVILIDIDIGLCIGVLCSLIYITVMGQKIKIEVLGCIPKTDIYVPANRYQSAVSTPGLLILHIAAGMNFANKDSVRHRIYKNLKLQDEKISHLLLDLSAVSYVDPSSVKSLLNIYENLRSKNINLYLAKCSSSVYKVLIKCRFFDVFPENQAFPSVHEAVVSVGSQYRSF